MCLGIQVPAPLIIFELVKKVCSIGTFMDMKYTRQNNVLM
jgi:hypothetical protein